MKESKAQAIIAMAQKFSEQGRGERSKSAPETPGKSPKSRERELFKARTVPLHPFDSFLPPDPSDPTYEFLHDRKKFLKLSDNARV